MYNPKNRQREIILLGPDQSTEAVDFLEESLYN